MLQWVSAVTETGRRQSKQFVFPWLFLPLLEPCRADPVGKGPEQAAGQGRVGGEGWKRRTFSRSELKEKKNRVWQSICHPSSCRMLVLYIVCIKIQRDLLMYHWLAFKGKYCHFFSWNSWDFSHCGTNNYHPFLHPIYGTCKGKCKTWNLYGDHCPSKSEVQFLNLLRTIVWLVFKSYKNNRHQYPCSSFLCVFTKLRNH